MKIDANPIKKVNIRSSHIPRVNLAEPAGDYCIHLQFFACDLVEYCLKHKHMYKQHLNFRVKKKYFSI